MTERRPAHDQRIVDAPDLVQAPSLWELVEVRASTSPDAVMAVDEHDRSLTFRQFRDQAEQAAAGLAEMGVDASDTVAWQLPTQLSSLVLMAALSRLGARQLALLPMYRERELIPLLHSHHDRSRRRRVGSTRRLARPPSRRARCTPTVRSWPAAPRSASAKASAATTATASPSP